MSRDGKPARIPVLSSAKDDEVLYEREAKDGKDLLVVVGPAHPAARNGFSAAGSGSAISPRRREGESHAHAPFFVDGARPVTQMRVRWDWNLNVIDPDRAEYLWAKIGGKGPKKPETNLNYNSLSIYNEAAIQSFSVFTEIPYLSMSPTNNF